MIPRAAYGRGNELFTEQQSILLFGGWRHFISTPTGNFEIPNPPESLPEMGFPLPALAPSGDQFATSFSFPDGFGYGDCDPTRHTCAKITPKYKSVMGVYSLRDKVWKFYGDFCSVGSAAFSPDGRKLAFRVETRIGNPYCRPGDVPPALQILDLDTGQLTPVPGSSLVIGNSQLSWSPDGGYLAVAKYGPEKSPGLIAVIDLGSWTQKVIAEGTDPSWSPKGDWIAYHAQWNQTCMLIHPDGTGATVVLDLRGRSSGWLFFETSWLLYSATVWSPDGDTLLLSEGQMDGSDHNVAMLDLATGKITTKSRNGRNVYGWVAEIK
jgi:hypothetical protein